MAFVDVQPAFLFEFLALVFPLEFGFVPHLCGEDLRLIVLHYAAHITRDALSVAALPFYQQFVHLSVLQGVLR